MENNGDFKLFQITIQASFGYGINLSNSLKICVDPEIIGIHLLFFFVSDGKTALKAEILCKNIMFTNR